MKIVMLAASLLLTACGGDPSPQQSREATDRETVFDPLTDPIERAKAVEGTVQQRKDDIDAALREVEAP